MKQKDLLLLTMSVGLIICVWIVFSVLHNFMATTIPTPTQETITPISADFDTDTIAKIKNRKIVSPIYELTGGTPSSPSSDLDLILSEIPELASVSSDLLEEDLQ
jgi:hypothetical protein